MVDEATVPLAAAAAGCRARIVRVGDRSTELLQYLAERGLRPGAEVAVESVDPLAGVMVVRTGAVEQALALSVAAQIQIATEPGAA